MAYDPVNNSWSESEAEEAANHNARNFHLLFLEVDQANKGQGPDICQQMPALQPRNQMAFSNLQ